DEDFSNVIALLASVGDAARLEASAPAPAAPAPQAGPAQASVPVPDAAAELAAPALPDAGPESASKTSLADTAIRVDLGLLDRVMNLVGELVLARNQILQYGVSSKDAGFVNATQRLNLLTTELQAGVMKTRMQPIGNVWNRFPRIVRDLATVCGK